MLSMEDMCYYYCSEHSSATYHPFLLQTLKQNVMCHTPCLDEGYKPTMKASHFIWEQIVTTANTPMLISAFK